MRKKIRLGEMLVNEGLIAEEQLQSALEGKKSSSLRLGQYLARNNYCKEEDIVNTLSRQLRILRYVPEKHPMDMGMAEILPAEVAKKNGAVPLSLRGRVLVVVMTDPLDIDALDALEIYTDREVEPMVCTEAEFAQLFTSVYGMYRVLDDVLESVESISIPDDLEGADGSDLDVNTLESQADQAPVIRLVNSIIAQAVNEQASDIHISPEKERIQIRFRVDGKLKDVPAPSRKLMPSLVSRLKILSRMDISVTRAPQDGRFTVNMEGREINIRVSCMPTIYGENVVMRLLDMSSGIYSLDELGMSSSDLKKIAAVIHKPYGMILSTGPTGSGKSTSLYAILQQVNKPDTNIITLEDPVEYRVPGIRQVQLNRRAGMTFASGLRSVLRQDPDIIMVGEIRDSETAGIAVQSALTGHRVLSTVHTNDAAGSITRLMDMGLEPFLVSSVLLTTFAQRLVRKVCSNCAEAYEPPVAGLRALKLPSGSECTYMKGKGCHS
ncbi:MAG: GspE/PulE family protein, partial [Desulfonatronovibrionaceae bacterium]